MRNTTSQEGEGLSFLQYNGVSIHFNDLYLTAIVRYTAHQTTALAGHTVQVK